ncbi:gamma-tubulin complex component 3 [Physcomitrium patens]|uniref:Gamma tubulin complex component C-terminal domain-containing protein n=1 Tax=Physcomitrium patens TaxID=3218 RepID=A0A7I4ENW0_PHYPA|nr:gamma-tubulin complex component 3-like [Physcomitrium patens]|eukprot:XP_024382207.1 gamma-tubulin complex component 3-like [Physcomitrella patens]
MGTEDGMHFLSSTMPENLSLLSSPKKFMRKYLRVFNFLWRLKRMEHATWQAMKPYCMIARVESNNEGGGRSQLALVLRRCQTLRNEMNHFVTKLQYYITFEVLEYSWSNFLEEMEEAHDLDELIAAHVKYLDSILEKALLDERSQLLCKTLFSLVDLILRFRAFADRLYENARNFQTRYETSLRPTEKNDTFSKSRSGQRELSTAQLSGDFLAYLGDEMDWVAVEYSSLLEGFIAQLPGQHIDLKFLSFRLDFSEYYTRLHTGMSTIPIRLHRTPINVLKPSISTELDLV